MQDTSARKKLFIMGCIMSVIHLVLLSIISSYDVIHTLTGDSHSYLAAAEMLSNSELHSIRPAGYPAFLLILKILTSTQFGFYLSIYIVQFILWLAILWLVLKFLPENHHWVWTSLFLLIIINPSFVMFANLVLSEILFLFIIILGFSFLHNFSKSKNDVSLILFTLCMLLTILVRPGQIYFGILSIVLTLLFFIRKKQFISGAVIVIMALVLLAWPIRKMKDTYGNYTISYIDKITQYRYLNSQCKSIENNEPLARTMKRRDAALAPIQNNLHEVSKLANDEITTLIHSNPGLVLKAFSKNLYLNFHTGNEYLPKGNHILGKHYYGLSRILNMFFVLLLLVCIPFFVLHFLKSTNKLTLLLPGILLFYCFYCWFTSGISFYQGDRFNVVWMPVLVIFIFQFSNKKTIC